MKGTAVKVPRIGFALAALTLAIDQLHKWWMLGPYDIAKVQPVSVGPYLDLVLAWNKGVSYGWFSQESDGGRWLLIAILSLVVVFLASWLWRSKNLIAGLSLGLLVGGALSNIIDRVIHGAVADFFAFHGFGYSWYVFNIADIAIVAGVVGLMYDSLKNGQNA